MLNKWDRLYIELCKTLSDNAGKDPSDLGTVACFIADYNHRPVSLGYNGFVQGLEDKRSWLEDRDTKYQLTLHAEDNAVNFANRDLYGCTMYVWPIAPCSICTSRATQKYISRIVCPRPNLDLRKYDRLRWDLTLEICRQKNIEFVGVSPHEV